MSFDAGLDLPERRSVGSRRGKLPPRSGSLGAHQPKTTTTYKLQSTNYEKDSTRTPRTGIGSGRIGLTEIGRRQD